MSREARRTASAPPRRRPARPPAAVGARLGRVWAATVRVRSAVCSGAAPVLAVCAAGARFGGVLAATVRARSAACLGVVGAVVLAVSAAVARFARVLAAMVRVRLAACVGAVGALVLAVWAVGAGSAAASALPISQCTTTSGVVLAVDFGHWGGPLLRSCGSTPTTGYTLLHQGGWTTTGTQHDGPALVCRIGYSGYQGGKQYPTAADDPCVLTPPVTAQWSYWHADPGQNTWTYSQLGAASYHPKPGSVDLWTFGATNVSGTQGRPAFSPDTVRAHNTTPGGGGSGGSGSGSGGTSGGGSSSSGGSGGKAPGGSGGHPATTAPAGSPRPSAHPSASPDASASTSATASAAPGGASPDIAPTAGRSSAPVPQDAEPTGAAGGSSGSFLPVAVTLAVVALLGTLIAVRVRQRRRAG